MESICPMVGKMLLLKCGMLSTDHAMLPILTLLSFLYMMFVTMDTNFRLKNQLVSNYSQDPGLGIGWVYMVPREEYERYLQLRIKDKDVSSFDFYVCFP